LFAEKCHYCCTSQKKIINLLKMLELGSKSGRTCGKPVSDARKYL